MNNGDVSLNAASITSMTINRWSNTNVASTTFYDLEDNSTGGRTVSFWATDLLSQSIVNWATAGKFSTLFPTRVENG